MTKPFGIKAYGTWTMFAHKKEYAAYLQDWIANTDGAEQERAYRALANLCVGVYRTDTDEN